MRAAITAFALAIAAKGFAQWDCLQPNGPFVTDRNIGADNRSISRMEATPGSTLMGVPMQGSGGVLTVMADDIVGTLNDWISRIDVYVYEPNATVVSYVTAAYVAVYDGEPGQGGTRIYDVSRLLDQTFASDPWPTPIYRVSDDNRLSSSNRVQKLSIGTGDIHISQGQQLWFVLAIEAPFPLFAVPVTPARPDDNALVGTWSGSAFDLAGIDNNGAAQGGGNDLAFDIRYACIPELSTMAAWIFGLAFLAKRRYDSSKCQEPN